MGNPALVAHGILEQWRTRAHEAHTKGHPKSLTGVRSQREIVRLASALSEVESLLARLKLDGKNVGAYQRQIPDWWRGLLVPEQVESRAIGPDEIITPEHLDEIDACASFLDFYVYTLEPEQSDSLRALIEHARAALAADSDLSDELRSFIHRLLTQIANALDDAAFGETFDFEEAVLRLRVAFQAATAEGTPHRDTWHTLWTSVVSGGATAALVQGGAIVLGAIGA